MLLISLSPWHTVEMQGACSKHGVRCGLQKVQQDSIYNKERRKLTMPSASVSDDHCVCGAEFFEAVRI